MSFGAGSDGFAAVQISSAGEVSATILDGVGRTIANAFLQPPTGQSPSSPLTWSLIVGDESASISGFGAVLETAGIDALGFITRVRSDGAGRVIQSIDAESNVNSFTFDANSNRLSTRDPNEVGVNTVWDARNRPTSQTDTQGATRQLTFDANSNILKSFDAKGNPFVAVFDARDRRTSLTNRTEGTETWSFDANSNLLSATDSDLHTTSFTYDPRNLKLTASYPDDNPPALDDHLSFAYDGAGRLITRTAENGDYVTLVYDMANRLTSRQYRDATKQPTDPPNDTDTFTYTAGMHLTSACYVPFCVTE